MPLGQRTVANRASTIRVATNMNPAPIIKWAEWTAVPVDDFPISSMSRWDVYGSSTTTPLTISITSASDQIVQVRLSTAHEWIGHVGSMVATDLVNTWVITNSNLHHGWRGKGLGCLMYLANQTVTRAFHGHVKMISTYDYLGQDTSDAALAVWQRLRTAGRMNKNPRIRLHTKRA